MLWPEHPENDDDQAITIAGKTIDRLDRFKFFGSMVTTVSNSSTVTHVRLADYDRCGQEIQSSNMCKALREGGGATL